MTTIAGVRSQTYRVWRSSFQSELNSALETHLRQAALIGVRAVLQTALVEELTTQLGFRPYARSISGRKSPEQQRSGFFERRVETSYGHIPDLRVPKLRRGNKDREWQVLRRYQSAQQSVLDKALYLYTLGLSVRDLQEALFLFLDRVLSRTAVNRVTIAAQAPMDAWRQAPITETPPVLIVDGVWGEILYPTGEIWTDRAGHQRQRVRGQERVILAAMAVWPDGRHYIVHYQVAEGEEATAWSAFLQQMIDRGLDGQAVRLIVSDGTKGLLEVLPAYLPGAQLQRCVVHKVRGFERYLSYTDVLSVDPETGQALSKEDARQQRRQAMKTEALDIFDAPTKAEAEQRLAQFVTKWEGVEHQAVHNFKWGIKRCFTFYQFEPSLHPFIRSTNLLERFFREFRAKADEIGAFPNEDSCLTVFHLVMVREHAKHDRVDFAKTT